jgi:hypothetical protein
MRWKAAGRRGTHRPSGTYPLFRAFRACEAYPHTAGIENSLLGNRGVDRQVNQLWGLVSPQLYPLHEGRTISHPSLEVELFRRP